MGSELGQPTSSPENVALGFVIVDEKGKLVRDGFQQVKLSPLALGVNSPVHYNGMIELPPGTYKMRFAAVDSSGRQGSLEHRFQVALASSGGVTVGSLVLAPLTSDRGLRAPAQAIVAVPFQAYADVTVASGTTPASVRVRVEIADRATGEVLTGADGAGARACRRHAARRLTRACPSNSFLPASTIATLVVTAGDAPPVRLTREFGLVKTVAAEDGMFADDIRHLPASGNDDSAAARHTSRRCMALALTVDGPRADVATREAVSAWLHGAALPETALPKDPASGPLLSTTMARGITRLRRGDLESAATAFRTAIKLASDFPPAAIYLGACYAAGGRDREAAGAWQLVLALGRKTRRSTALPPMRCCGSAMHGRRGRAEGCHARVPEDAALDAPRGTRPRRRGRC